MKEGSQQLPAKQRVLVRPAVFLTVAEHDDVALGTSAFIVKEAQGLADRFRQITASAGRGQPVKLLPDEFEIMSQFGLCARLAGHRHDLLASQQQRHAIVGSQLL